MDVPRSGKADYAPFLCYTVAKNYYTTRAQYVECCSWMILGYVLPVLSAQD